MKRITITLDDKTASEVRAAAVKKHMSISGLVVEMLKQKMRETAERDFAMRVFLSKTPVKLQHSRARYPARDVCYDRNRVR